VARAPLSISGGATTIAAGASGSFIAVSEGNSAKTGSGSVSVSTRNRVGRSLALHGHQLGGQRGHDLAGTGEAAAARPRPALLLPPCYYILERRNALSSYETVPES
jgi:hypothetical protein